MEYFLIPLIGFFGFCLKGITGTGTTTVIVALCSLIIEPKLTIVLASFVNMFGGLSMIKVDPVPLPKKYWIPVTVMMIIGSVLGAWALKVVPKDVFEIILGIAFFLVSMWFLFKKTQSKPADHPPPNQATPADMGVGFFGGFCGGFIGSNAPPLVFHFSRYLNKRQMRRLLVLIFLPSAIAQTATFWMNGMLDKQIVIYGLTILPCMILGIYIGNRAFHKISEQFFRRVMGVLLIIVSLKLIF